MSSTITKSLSTDFSGAINLSRLQQEITDNGTVTTTCTAINLVADVVDIVFQSTLSGAESTELDVVVAAHNGTAVDAAINVTTTGSLDSVLTLTAAQTASRTVVLPDASTDLVGTDVPQTLTFKTIVAANNTITIDTSQVTEGSNLYYTDGRVSTWIDTQKGSNNGLASLDAGGKVPSTQLSLSNVLYIGTWNATTNTPTLADGTGTQGNYYVVSVSGGTSLDGITDWVTGDWVIFNGTVWQKSDHTDVVTSVAGKQGVVTLQLADITDLATTSDLPEGSNQYFTTARVDANSSVTANTAKVSADGNIDTHADVVITTVADKEVLAYNTGTSKWINQTPAEAGLAGASHTHATTDITSGTLADARVAASNVTQHEGSITHQNLGGAGSNTHAQIDTHIADATVHRIINDAGTSATELWSASKINTELSTVVSPTYDKQFAHSAVATETTAAVFTDLDSATLTTTDLGATSTYEITFSCETSNSVAGNTNSFQILVNGAAQSTSIAACTIGQNQTGSANHVSVSSTILVAGVTSSQVIKIQWQTDAGTAFVRNRRLMISGTRTSQIV